MEKLIVAAALLLMVPVWAPAQDADHQYRGEAYLFIGGGKSPEGDGLRGVGYAGGGGEVRLFKGLGVNGEAEVMGRPGVWGEGLFSVDGSYHFPRASSKSKLVPFVEAGYTRQFTSNYLPFGNLFNFGGGIHYWAFKRVGLRFDFRDYVNHHSGFITHYPAFRIGFALR